MLFEKTLANRQRGFSNGRFARNIAERLIMKHSYRIHIENSYNRDKMMQITMADVNALLEDSEIRSILDGKNSMNKRIGFAL